MCGIDEWLGPDDVLIGKILDVGLVEGVTESDAGWLESMPVCRDFMCACRAYPTTRERPGNRER